MYTRYKDKVHFVIVYVIEPHPSGSRSPYAQGEWTDANSQDKQGNPIKQPMSYSERVKLAQLLIKDDGIAVPILVDKMNNVVWQTYGPAPNLAYLIGTDKKVIVAQEWYSAREMESAIAQLR